MSYHHPMPPFVGAPSGQILPELHSTTFTEQGQDEEPTFETNDNQYRPLFMIGIWGILENVRALIID